MLSKAKIKYIRSLHQKKFRQRYDKFIAEGTKITLEILQKADIQVEMLIASAEWLERHPNIPQNIPVVTADKKGFKEISTLSTPSEVMVVATPLVPQIPTDIQHQVSLFLDGIQDPGNLGTIVRIADWFGIEHVFLGHGTVDAYNPKVVQSSMGAFLRVNMIALGVEDLVAEFPDTRLMGADMQGKSVFELSPDEKKGIIVIGNEGKGISPTLRSHIQHWIHIPSKGGAESLNAGVATGIICAILTQ